MTLISWLILAFLSVLWGGSFFFVGVAVNDLTPLTIVMMRLVPAAVMLWIYLLISGVKIPTSWRVWRSFFFMGLMNNALPFSLIVWAQTSISSGLASIFNATTPMFTALIAGMLLADERLTLAKTVGILLGLFGVIVMVGPTALSGLGGEVFPQLAILLAAICYGVAATYGRKVLAQGVDTRVIAAGQVTASALMIMLMAGIFEHPIDELAIASLASWGAVIALALASTALAYLLYFHLLSTVGATNISLVAFLVPVSAILLGMVVLNENLKVEEIAGMLLISLGLACIDGRLWKKFTETTPQ